MNYLFKNIKYLRVNIDYKQDELAAVLGITAMALGNYERGKTDVSTDMLIKIADFFKVSIDMLLKEDIRAVGTGSLENTTVQSFTGTGIQLNNSGTINQDGEQATLIKHHEVGDPSARIELLNQSLLNRDRLIKQLEATISAQRETIAVKDEMINLLKSNK